jgi:hypothetical protein
MSAIDAVAASYPVAVGFFAESSAFFTNTPAVLVHHLIQVKTFADVVDGDYVLLPIPVPTPTVMPAADVVAGYPLLWGRVTGKIVRATGERDLLIQIVDGKHNITVTPGLPNTPGITLPDLTNVLLPMPMLLTVVQAKLDEGQLQAAVALKTTGRSFVRDSGSVAKGESRRQGVPVQRQEGDRASHGQVDDPDARVGH